MGKRSHLVYNILAESNSGWGVRSGAVPQDSAIGVVKKSNAAAYWDNKTTELVIPDINDADAAFQGEAEEVVVSAAPVMETKMIGLEELNKDFSFNVPTSTTDGIDISLLTCQIRPIVDLIETDMHWDYQTL